MEIVGAVLAYTNQDEFESLILKSMELYDETSENAEIKVLTDTWDTVQDKVSVY